MNPLTHLLSQPTVDIAAVRALFDGASHADRLAYVRTLPRKLFKVLYDNAGSVPFKDDALVPRTLPPFTPVRHFGTNSMLLFRTFTKVMYRDEQGQVCGRNAQTFSWVTGPGYYTANTPAGSTEWTFDYLKLPTQTPQGWPKVMHNARGLSYFVFRDLFDINRFVSEHVVVGKATRGGQEIGQYFVLIKES